MVCKSCLYKALLYSQRCVYLCAFELNRLTKLCNTGTTSTDIHYWLFKYQFSYFFLTFKSVNNTLICGLTYRCVIGRETHKFICCGWHVVLSRNGKTFLLWASIFAIKWIHPFFHSPVMHKNISHGHGLAIDGVWMSWASRFPDYNRFFNFIFYVCTHMQKYCVLWIG